MKFRNTNNNINSQNPQSLLFKQIPKIDVPFNYPDYKRMSKILKSYNIHPTLSDNKNDKCQEANVVYKVNCKRLLCELHRRKKCSLKTPINEHRSSKNIASVFYAHKEKFNHEFDWNSYYSLPCEADYRERLFSEVLRTKFIYL